MGLQDRDPGAAILKLTGKTGQFEFLCPAEMQGLYGHTNQYMAPQTFNAGNLYRNEAPTLLWESGKDNEVTLELKLVVGASIDIDTPGELMELMNKLAALCQATGDTRPGQEPPETVKLQIGTWFARKALVLSGTFGFGRPWDPGTGLPYVGFVNYSLQYVYESKLPTVDTFSFDRG